MNTKHFSDMMEAIDLCASSNLTKPHICGIHFLVSQTEDENIIQLCATDKNIFIRTEMNLQFFIILFEKKYSVKFDPSIHVQGVFYLNPEKREQLKKSHIQINQKYPEIRNMIPKSIVPIFGCRFPVIFDFKYLSRIRKVKELFSIDNSTFKHMPVPDFGSRKSGVCIFYFPEKTYISLKVIRVSRKNYKKIPNFKKMTALNDIFL